MRKLATIFSFKELFLFGTGVAVILLGLLLVWLATLQLPDLNAFSERRVSQSTKIYDRTGEVLLYDVGSNIRRTVVPFDAISPDLKHASVAIEDASFYEHHGVRPMAFLRAVLVNAFSLQFSQGGSTITQQVVKNALLTTDKKISRKIKEWVLAIKLERIMSKDDILGIYLNESPYGGNIYGVEEASLNFFGKHAKDVDLAEAAYLAALPQAPSYFSPYGNHKPELEKRKNLVLTQMHEHGYITNTELAAAKAEKVVFQPPSPQGISAPHFVVFIKDYLEEKYGEKAVEEGGYKVTTTLDYKLQEKAEEIAKRGALANEKKFNAENVAFTALDPATGQILAMVGSRDYFDKAIDGNFNVTLAHRQPGSSFKPFVYATAFNKGYTPDTVLFDLRTQFSTTCAADNFTTEGACYSPVNYDGKFKGPVSLRSALAESRNIPAVKLLYLAGVKDSLNTAKDMGINSLADYRRYGLTLVLGGGEVSLLDMTSAYGVFANNGVRLPYTGILKIEDPQGNTLEAFTPNPKEVLPPESAAMVSDILSDNAARAPEFGATSALYIPDRPVAVKTGTTNDYRDAWVLGYTPHLVVGAWAGNNDNSPMVKNIAGFIIAPLWNELMTEALKNYPVEYFTPPPPINENLKPALRGIWQGGESYFIDKASGAAATDMTPPEMREERVVQKVHSILYWVDKNDPTGPPPRNPDNDRQFTRWELPVRAWAASQGLFDQSEVVIPTATDTTHTAANLPRIQILTPTAGVSIKLEEKVNVSVKAEGQYPVERVEYYLNGKFVGSNQSPFNFSFIPNDIDGIQPENELKAVAIDSVKNRGETTIHFTVSQ